MKNMKKFYIIANSDKDKDLVVTHELEEYLKSKKVAYHIHVITPKEDAGNARFTNEDEIDDDTDCIIVTGGDGTLIQASRDIRDKNIPLIGINLGYLGYLTEIEKEDIQKDIDMLLDGNYTLESRIMLNGSVYRDDKLVFEDISLNDIVVGRAESLRIVDFKMYVDGEFLNLYSADGVIVSTPTGSTAYNLSAGGPILEPKTNIVAITPICSHTLNNRSVVISADSDVDVVICPGRHLSGNNTVAYFDGNSTFLLKENDVLKIRKSKLTTKFVRIHNKSFIEILHSKMDRA